MLKSIRTKLARRRRDPLQPIGADFDRIFDHFLSEVFGLEDPVAFAATKTDWWNFERSMEPALFLASQDWLTRARARYGASAGVLSDRWLAEEVAEKQAELDKVGFPAFVEGHFDFSPPLNAASGAGEHFIYVKLNHGFWEDLLGLFAAHAEQRRRRPRGLDFSWDSSVGSGFLSALTYLTRDAAELSSDSARFADIRYAMNLTNGMRPNEQIAIEIETLKPLLRAVALSAAVGAASYFKKLFGGRRVLVDDGCFPKRAYLDGTLRTFLVDEAARSDRIVFAVPPHLRDIRIEIPNAPKQEVIFLSRERVQESWIATLCATAAHILSRLQAGENVLVIAQGGPFVVLLGLYLAKVVPDLAPEGTRLAYFDLGQVTDIANPENSGPWIRNYGVGPDRLFSLSGTG